MSLFKSVKVINYGKAINIGPENKANQATRAIGFTSLLNGLTKTCPKAQILAPVTTKAAPINLPSKLGEPVKI